MLQTYLTPMTSALTEYHQSPGISVKSIPNFFLFFILGKQWGLNNEPQPKGGNKFLKGFFVE
jgi:hypothetical protein